MKVPSPASNRDILAKRVRRLLQLDRDVSDRSELSASVLPYIRSLGSPLLIGGAIRDLARGGRQAFSSDLDFVIHNGDRHQLYDSVEKMGGVRNKFGGFRIGFVTWKIDVWHIEDTWAKTAGYITVSQPKDLLDSTFFDWDSALYDLASGRLIIPDDYLAKLGSQIMDVRLAKNPNPAGALVRALRRAALWDIRFGPSLTAFSLNKLQDIPWADLVSLDGQAFTNPVLKYLELGSILERLHVPDEKGVTTPAPGWRSQLNLPIQVS